MPCQIWILFCHAGAWWRVCARPRCACGLPLRAGAGLGAAGGASWAAGRGRRFRGAGARSSRAGPVSAAPCRSAGGGKRGARGGRAAAAPPSRPRRLWPGLRRALGARSAAARRPRAAVTRGPTDGKGRGSCQRVARPLRWRNLLFLPRLAGALLCLSLLLTLSLPGWKFPLTSRKKTDGHTRARRGGGRWGRRRGWGKPAPRGRPAQGDPPPAAPLPLGAAAEGDQERAVGGLGVRVPRGAPSPWPRSLGPEGWSERGRPLKTVRGHTVPGSRLHRRGGARCTGGRSRDSQGQAGASGGDVGSCGAHHAMYRSKSHLYVPFKLSQLHQNPFTNETGISV